MIIAFGERETGVPFTFPEIKMLRTLAEVIDGLYTRARFALQARQAEQLATIGLIGAGLAHELRNPIVAIDTFAQLLPQRLDDEEFLRDFAEVIPGEAKRIQAMAEQLLDLSRPKEYELLPTDLHAVLSDTVFLTHAQALSSNVALSFEPKASPCWLIADAQAVRQIFLNLILNGIQAIASARKPGRIEVRTIDCDGSVIVEVEDDGPGIPEAIRSRLFRPFASAEKRSGVGLGLAICAEIVKVHRGSITAENLPDERGAVFRVRFPIHDATLDSAGSASGSSDAGVRTRVLPETAGEHSHSTAA